MDPGSFTRSLTAEVQARLGALLTGIERYRAHPYRRRLEDPPCCWEAGSARLLDFRAAAKASSRSKTAQPKPAVLIVPSLINRAYVLDLTGERSLCRWLASQGFRPYLVDWGAPGEEERGFTLTDYVAGYLERMLDAVLEAEQGRPPLLMGYCMGGLLTLALAQRRERDLSGLALLATPWDFHAGANVPGPDRLALAIRGYLPLAAQLGYLPVDALQSLFALLEPMAVARKFITFAKLSPDSEVAKNFIAVEDWINDGVPLAGPVARECLEGWYLQNRTMENRWTIAGREVIPEELTLPSLAVIPAQDRIVPPESALALSSALKDVEILRPRSGHVGMLVGQQALEDTWQPMARWMSALAP